MTQSARIQTSRLVAVAAAIAMLFALSPLAHARGRKPEDVFSGDIITSKKRLPTSARSAGAYIKKLRKAKTHNFWEDKEKKEWRVYFAAFFRRPLNDLEVTVKFYDITDGPKHLIASFQQFLEGRGQRSVVSKAILERKFFGVNKQIYMTLENRGRILASTKFKILGEGEHYSGKVDFTEDDDSAKAKSK